MVGGGGTCGILWANSNNQKIFYHLSPSFHCHTVISIGGGLMSSRTVTILTGRSYSIHLYPAWSRHAAFQWPL